MRKIIAILATLLLLVLSGCSLLVSNRLHYVKNVTLYKDGPHSISQKDVTFNRMVRQTEAILNSPLNVCKGANVSNGNYSDFYKNDYFREGEGLLIELEKPIKVKVRIKYDGSVREVNVDTVAVSFTENSISLISHGEPFSGTYSGTKGLTKNLQKTADKYMKRKSEK